MGAMGLLTGKNNLGPADLMFILILDLNEFINNLNRTLGKGQMCVIMVGSMCVAILMQMWASGLYRL